MHDLDFVFYMDPSKYYEVEGVAEPCMAFVQTLDNTLVSAQDSHLGVFLLALPP